MSDLRSWSQLVRVPNTLTSCADVLAGMCIVGGSSHHFVQHPLAALIVSLASICFYWSGMVLNDVFDIDQDRLQGRPGPLVTGTIALRTAHRIGIVLMVSGIVLCIASPIAMASYREQSSWLRLAVPGLVGCFLAAAVYAYDGPFKKSVFAPLIMGICRSLNMGLGIAVVVSVFPDSMGGAAVAILLGHGLYVTGLTIAARREADLSQSRGRLFLGWSVCAAGAALIAFSAWFERDRSYRLDPYWVYPLLVAILLLPLARRAIDALWSLRPQQLGMAIKQAIFSILFLDATIALQYAGDTPGIMIASMVVPTLLLARWFRST